MSWARTSARVRPDVDVCANALAPNGRLSAASAMAVSSFMMSLQRIVVKGSYYGSHCCRRAFTRLLPLDYAFVILTTTPHRALAVIPLTVSSLSLENRTLN